MNTFLENRAPATFIHLKEYLNEITARPLRFFIQEDSISISAIIKSHFKRIKFEDDILENNFRLIETYFPEILYILFTTAHNRTLREAISKAAKKLHANHNENLVENYLMLKLFQLFEAIFFGNLLMGVWKGKWQQKVYALKQDNDLKYYSVLEGRKLFDYLLENVKVSCSSSYNALTVRFQYR